MHHIMWQLLVLKEPLIAIMIYIIILYYLLMK